VREYSVPASFSVGEHDNIVSSVFSHERNDPDHVIFQRLVDGTWTDVTCAQAANQIRSAALGLIAEGVKPGDRVALLSATRYEWPILDFAILAAGALTVPIYETSSAPQIEWILSNSGARAVIVETPNHRTLVDQVAGRNVSQRDGVVTRQLAVQQFPNATFTSSSASVPGSFSSAQADVSAPGKLTIHGVTKDVTATAKAQMVGDRVEIAGTLTINMTDYGVSPPQAPFVTVDPTATIEFDIFLTKA